MAALRLSEPGIHGKKNFIDANYKQWVHVEKLSCTVPWNTQDVKSRGSQRHSRREVKEILHRKQPSYKEKGYKPPPEPIVPADISS